MKKKKGPIVKKNNKDPIDFSKAKKPAPQPEPFCDYGIVKTPDDLCSMPLHAVAFDVHKVVQILRVVGGWLYLLPSGFATYVPDPTRDTEK